MGEYPRWIRAGMVEVLRNTMGLNYNTESVVIPFELNFNPIKKLAIITFEKDPDDIYSALELQCFDDGLYGQGYRVKGRLQRQCFTF